ncbi:MAG TPA: hypothetical protein VMY37_34195 [Thermoguttaceae bacterium]|nr:hypothetical protein [Thermoguttaceae bacterium]
MPKKKRWHPSQETDELVFAVCDRFLSQLDQQYNPQSLNADGGRKGAAAAIADWLKERWGRDDLTREKIYPLFWEAARRRFLFLQPPRELHLAQRIADTYHVGRELGDEREVQVVNVRSPEAIRHVTSAGAELVLSLVEKIGREKRPVHIGLGAGYSAMMVARHLADRIRSDPDCPSLVLHALSAGGFQVDKPQRSPITYFNYFDGALTKVEFVALFSHTIVPNDDYERIRKSPGVQKAFERADEIDIVVTSFAWAHDEHGMLRQFLEHLIDAGELDPDTIRRMLDAGWTGDVQFRPYAATGPILEECPVRAVTLFELSDLARIAQTEGKHVVLLARPCGECGALKTDALKPLLTERSLRLWTHLVLDVDTAGALLKSSPAGDVPIATQEPSGAAG